jgi:hypothetical protein
VIMTITTYENSIDISKYTSIILNLNSISSISIAMSSENPLARVGRAIKHNYRLLNNGSDDEADIADRIEQPLAKRLYLVSSSQNQSIEYAI